RNDPPCGEGLGVGGIPPADVLQSPPPNLPHHRAEGAPSAPGGGISSGAWSKRARVTMRGLAIVFAAVMAVATLDYSAEAQSRQPFSAWLESFWPEAQRANITRATFDRAFDGVTPDLSLPDLVLPEKRDARP